MLTSPLLYSYFIYCFIKFSLLCVLSTRWCEFFNSRDSKQLMFELIAIVMLYYTTHHMMVHYYTVKQVAWILSFAFSLSWYRAICETCYLAELNL